MTIAPDPVPRLSTGSHLDAEDGACLMEVVSTLAGENFSDHPRCTDPVLASLARLVNDETTDDARQSFRPFAVRLACAPGHARGRTAAGIVAAVTMATIAHVGSSRALDRHHRRAARRLARLTATPVVGLGDLRERATAALYARGPAQHALTCCLRAVRRLPPPARDQALVALLTAGLDAASGPGSLRRSPSAQAGAGAPRSRAAMPRSTSGRIQ